MEVNGFSSVNGISPMNQTRAPAEARPTSETKSLSPRDAVEISSAGRMLDHASRSDEFRAERLAEIRASIEDGSYDTPERLEAALHKMFETLDFSDEINH